VMAEEAGGIGSFSKLDFTHARSVRIPPL